MCLVEWSATPVAFSLFGLPLRWYALSYIVGFLLALWWAGRLIQRRLSTLTKPQLDSASTTALVAIIVGGRLGYVVFYNPAYFFAHPLEIFYVWQGGMSFHGALVGVAVGLFWFARRHNITPLALGDLVVASAPIGLFLGRLANFANGELVGSPVIADWVKWGVCFNGELLARHPSQLYEALCEGLVLFIVVNWVLRLQARPQLQKVLPVGSAVAVFLVGYGVMRFAVEFVRQPDQHIGLIGGSFGGLVGSLSMGQWLCLVMIAIGGGLWHQLRSR